MKKLIFASLVLGFTLLPFSAIAAPGATPPWTTSDTAPATATQVCTTQKGIASVVCKQTTGAGTETAPVNGACPIAGTQLMTRCAIDPNAPVPTAPPPPPTTPTTQQPAGTSGNTSGFVSLTKIPSITFASNSADLPAFLNTIYRICIGLAAVLGVLQIMRAGIVWMTAAGSHEKLGEAKGLIRDALLGLLLVLAPTIVFGIINPEILSLKIEGIEKLNLDKTTAPSGSGSGGAGASGVLWIDETNPYATAATRCVQENGTPVLSCKPEGGGTIAPAPSGGTCAGTLVTVCMSKSGTSSTAGSCSKTNPYQVVPAGKVCNADGWSTAPIACCVGASTGGTCCVSKYSITKPPPSMIPSSLNPDPTTGLITPRPNPNCTVNYPDQTILAESDASRQGWAESCCQYQDAYGISCDVFNSNLNTGVQRVCVCKTK